MSNLTKSQVKHTRNFYKHVLLTVSLFIISLLLAYGWINCHNEKKVFEANDIKYRFWKADSNAILLKLTHYTDSLYDMDKESFKKRGISAEQQIADQEKQFRLAGEKEKILKTLNIIDDH